MEFQYYGANCVRLSTRQASIVVDDNLGDLGLKSVTKSGDIALFSGAHAQPKADVKMVIDLPGEYEVSDIAIHGIAARAHLDETSQKSATIFKIATDEIRVAVIGHIHPKLSDEQLEALGTIDVMIIPVGGNGYTLDPAGVLQIIKEIEPKIIIPTHYSDLPTGQAGTAIKYPVSQLSLDEVLKGLAMEPQGDKVAKLKLKASDLTEETQLIVLDRL